MWQTRRLSGTYKVGEVVFIREPFYLDKCHDHLTAKEVIESGLPFIVSYQPASTTGRKRNKRYMPSAFSRNLIKITSVRSENLQEISYADCKAEGVEDKDAYKAEFEQLHGVGIWELNPLVYVFNYELL